MALKIVLLISFLIMAGCTVFPSTTSVSVTSKATDGAVPTVKAQQNFKWSKKK